MPRLSIDQYLKIVEHHRMLTPVIEEIPRQAMENNFNPQWIEETLDKGKDWLAKQRIVTAISHAYQYYLKSCIREGKPDFVDINIEQLRKKINTVCSETSVQAFIVDIIGLSVEAKKRYENEQNFFQADEIINMLNIFKSMFPSAQVPTSVSEEASSNSRPDPNELAVAEFLPDKGRRQYWINKAKQCKSVGHYVRDVLAGLYKEDGLPYDKIRKQAVYMAFKPFLPFKEGTSKSNISYYLNDKLSYLFKSRG